MQDIGEKDRLLDRGRFKIIRPTPFRSVINATEPTNFLVYHLLITRALVSTSIEAAHMMSLVWLSLPMSS